MALGDAARLRGGRDGFKVAIGNGKAIIPSPIYEHIPWLWTVRDCPQDAHWIVSAPGNRPYCDYERMTREVRERWGWGGAIDGRMAFQLLKRKYWKQNYHATPAPIVLTDEERLIGDVLTSHDQRTVVLVEPNIKPGAAENKRWPFRRYQQVVKALKNRCVFVQMSRPMLDGPVPIPAMPIRSALGVVSAVDAYLGAEGGLHHAAAAFCKPAVVVFGGYINPRVTGYEFHRNLWVECVDEGCPGPTQAGEAALAAITVEQVVTALDQVLEEAQ